MLTLDEMIGETVKSFGVRNRRYIEWADDAETPIPALEAAPEESETDEDASDDE